MAIKFRKSESIEYIIKKWFSEILVINEQYMDYLSEVIKISYDQILDLAAELQRHIGKDRPRNVHENRSYLIRAISKLDLKLIELKEFAFQYKTLIEEINGLELTLKSPGQLINLITVDIATLEELHLVLKNLVKATNVAFKTTKKPKKKLDDNFDLYFKSFSRLIRGINREFNEILEQFNIVLLELETEVEHTKTLTEEKVA